MNRRALGAWFLIAILAAILIASAYFAYQGMTFHSEFQMPAGGYVALWLGVAFSLIVGVGLMTLMFFSSRTGYDEPAQREPDEVHGGGDARPNGENPPKRSANAR